MRIYGRRFTPASALLAVLLPCSALARVRVASPAGRNAVVVETHGGRLYYTVQRDGRPLLTPSLLGFEFRGAPPLRDSLRIVDSSRGTFDETWTQPWGEVTRIRDHHNELKVGVEETKAPSRKFTLAVRAFNDGVAFRYEFPAQPSLADFEIMDELTEFAMADNARAWWIASNRPRLDRSEQLWSEGPVSTLDSVQTPLTMEFRDGKTFAVIHEANLVDYARMDIRGPRMDNRTLHADLAPMADGVKVRGHTPLVTPWRTIQIADKVTELSPSVIGLNLNPPSVIPNTEWIKPMKYVGIWWGMHINTMTWSSGPKHGATTANTKRYIDLIHSVLDRKSTRLNSSHSQISYAVFCLKKKKECRILAPRDASLRTRPWCTPHQATAPATAPEPAQPPARPRCTPVAQLTASRVDTP